MLSHSSALTCLLALALPSTAAAQQELYAVSGLGQIVRIDDYATQPTSVQVGDASTLNGRIARDIAVDPTTGEFVIVGTTTGFSGTSRLFRIDPATFISTEISTFSLFPSYSLDVAPDSRGYSTGSVFGYLSALDMVTGQDALVAFGNGPLSESDMAIDLDGTVLIASVSENFVRYDPMDGTVVDLGPHGLGNRVTGVEIDTDGTIYVITLFGVLYRYDMATGTSTMLADLPIFAQGLGFAIPAGPPAGDVFHYCPYTVPNSTGQIGRIDVTGSTVASDNAMTLVASDLPANRFGAFFYSDLPEPESPFSSSTSDGLNCMRGSIGLFNGPGQLQRISAGGTMQLTLDLTNLPVGGGAASAMAGDILGFQAWFRDMPNPVGNNYTGALQVIFR